MKDREKMAFLKKTLREMKSLPQWQKFKAEKVPKRNEGDALTRRLYKFLGWYLRELGIPKEWYVPKKVLPQVFDLFPESKEGLKRDDDEVKLCFFEDGIQFWVEYPFAPAVWRPLYRQYYQVSFLEILQNRGWEALAQMLKDIQAIIQSRRK